mmetsp:Transcript_1189/g.3294  ORF Transcript_1189/g.3294 Transcript_1189/m.3294 type:complete len:100 (+) Transcript_1189:474-773(+)
MSAEYPSRALRAMLLVAPLDLELDLLPALPARNIAPAIAVAKALHVLRQCLTRCRFCHIATLEQESRGCVSAATCERGRKERQTLTFQVLKEDIFPARV